MRFFEICTNHRARPNRVQRRVSQLTMPVGPYPYIFLPFFSRFAHSSSYPSSLRFTQAHQNLTSLGHSTVDFRNIPIDIKSHPHLRCNTTAPWAASGGQSCREIGGQYFNQLSLNQSVHSSVLRWIESWFRFRFVISFSSYSTKSEFPASSSSLSVRPSDFLSRIPKSCLPPLPTWNNNPLGYRIGSIIRVKMTNFMIYHDEEMRPGPGLNLLLGPNGSGQVE